MLDQWILSRVARKTIKREVSASAINVILEDASRTYKELPKSPVDYGLGLKLVVNTMRYNIALYRAMLEVDISDQDAKSHIESMNWTLFRLGGSPMRSLSVVRGKNAVSRISWIDTFLWKYFFTKPYQRESIASDADIAFDVKKCPIQEYFRSQDSVDLCYHAACKHDYKLASKWTAELERTTTLANGDEKCDFKFYIYRG